jgi:hypothetical protein
VSQPGLFYPMWAAAWQARVSWHVDIGATGFWPGNSQPCGRALTSGKTRLSHLRTADRGAAAGHNRRGPSPGPATVRSVPHIARGVSPACQARSVSHGGTTSGVLRSTL